MAETIEFFIIGIIEKMKCSQISAEKPFIE